MLDYTNMEYELVPGAVIPIISEIDVSKYKIEVSRKLNEVLYKKLEKAMLLTMAKRNKRINRTNSGVWEQGKLEQIMSKVLLEDESYQFSVDGIKTVYSLFTGEDGSEHLSRVDELEKLCEVYGSLKHKDKSHPLLLISKIVYDFIMISPFDSGNVEIIEVFIHVMLAEFGYDFGRYVQLERDSLKPVLQQLDEIYKNEPKNMYNGLYSFTIGFLSWIRLCYERIEERALRSTELPKRDRIDELVVESPVPLSKRDICSRLPDISETTIEARLAELCKSNKIERRGTKRSSVYVGVKEKSDGR